MFVETDILIIGAGPAGLTAAIYAQRAGMRAVVFDRMVYGGQVANTLEIENYPAIEKISGVDFSNAIYQQAVNLGAEIRFETVEKLELSGEKKMVVTAEGNTYYGKAVIIANGAKRRRLGCPGENELDGRGVSYCATCDGAFFRNKTVAIVGGGNTALEDALFLSGLCSKVYLIHRRGSFRGEKIMADAVAARENVEILFDSVVEEILGDGGKVCGASVKNLLSGEKTKLEVSGVFVAVGYAPENSLFEKWVDVDEAGYVIADETCRTSCPGVYVAGDSRTKPLRQIVTAAADGAVAAFTAAAEINLHRTGSVRQKRIICKIKAESLLKTQYIVL